MSMEIDENITLSELIEALQKFESDGYGDHCIDLILDVGDDFDYQHFEISELNVGQDFDIKIKSIDFV